MLLEVYEPPDHAPREVTATPDAALIERTVRGLAWSAITFVVLREDDDNFFEVSGSLDPSDGLSSRYFEKGEEHVARDAPETLDLLVALLVSYAAGDSRWRTMIPWD